MLLSTTRSRSGCCDAWASELVFSAVQSLVATANARTRRHIMLWLSEFAPRYADFVVPLATDALTLGGDSIWGAAATLRKYGPASASGAEQLATLAATARHHTSVRLFTDALIAIGPAGAAAVPELMRGIEESSYLERHLLRQALASIDGPYGLVEIP